MAEKIEIYLENPIVGEVGPRHLIKANLMHDHVAKEGPVVTGPTYHLQCFPSQYFLIF
jgi:hypothetical protein